ncbi:hypothetical protein [Amycolatopsis sp. NBC_01480]|uniref:hypothetical protein n=1 Tax=Amycolatopsis sp. NBC_01480 TaxID=2903562 RepID=UPI002E28F9FE|nr:hypothetical protein [Amycolatopsis sp. NBC_01480]
MSVGLRLNGDENEVAAVVELLASVLEMASNGRTYPNRGGFGVRVYAEVRPLSSSSGPVSATAARMDRRKLPSGRRAVRARGDVR